MRLWRTSKARSHGQFARLQHDIFKGDVLSTLAVPDNLPLKIAVLRLDTDWYESTRMELETLYPRLSVDGVIMIDDYGHWTGARRAVDEYFARGQRPLLQYTDATGRAGSQGFA